MKLKEFNSKQIKMLHDLVAFKWIKADKYQSETLKLYMPDNIHDGDGVDRMGHRYTCEVLATGPKVTQVKTGDRFLLHEYDKVDQGTSWSKEDVMFCEEKTISCLVGKDDKIMIQAKQITDKMMDEYEDY